MATKVIILSLVILNLNAALALVRIPAKKATQTSTEHHAAGTLSASKAAQAWAGVQFRAKAQHRKHREVPIADALRRIVQRGVPDEVEELMKKALTASPSSKSGLLQANASNAKHMMLRAAVAKTDAATKVLNQMLLETTEEIDVETERCDSYKTTTEKQMETAREQMSKYNEMASGFSADIQEASARQQELEGTMESLHADLNAHIKKCDADLAVQREEIRMIQADLAVANGVVNQTSCDPAKQAALLECLLPQMSGKLSMLQTDEDEADGEEEEEEEEEKQPHRALSHYYAHSRISGQLATSFLQTAVEKHRHHHRHRKKSTHRRHKKKAHHRRASHRHRDHHHHSEKARPEGAFSHLQILSREGPNQTVNVSTEPVDADKQERKCTINNSPNCQKFVDAMMTMMGEIGDREYEMKEELHETETECDTVKADYENQVSAATEDMGKAQAEIMKATSQKDEAELQSRLKEEELETLGVGFNKQMQECDDNLKNLDETKCGCSSMRSELQKLAGKRPYYQDCEVSEWVEGDCSASCGGGHMLLTRTVITPAKLGAACPPLSMKMSCGDVPCPIDCHVADWAEWSGCTADCGGGVRQKVRSVLTEPANQGEPCPETELTESCNTFSCDKDCTLNEWTPWSGCSKACGGGFQERNRIVAEPAKGNGLCPPAGESMTEFLSCNNQPCKPKEVKCASKVDVVILLDGSGSVGTKGWAATKAFAEKLVKLFKTGPDAAQVAVVMFSGPSTWRNIYKCARTGDEKTCGLYLVAALGTDMAALAGSIAKLAFPKATTNTSGALAMALQILREGRQDAQSVVMVVTDGRPNFTWKTNQAARKVRKSARLMFVPVGGYVPMDGMKRWASKPVRENIIPVRKFTDLQKPKALRQIITDMCPVVE